MHNKSNHATKQTVSNSSKIDCVVGRKEKQMPQDSSISFFMTCWHSMKDAVNRATVKLQCCCADSSLSA